MTLAKRIIYLGYYVRQTDWCRLERFMSKAFVIGLIFFMGCGSVLCYRPGLDLREGLEAYYKFNLK